MNELDENEWRALRALGRISDGHAAFLNVLHADLLVAKNLALRFGAGQFVLTDAGRGLLERAGDPD